jgi:hypothetical protein
MNKILDPIVKASNPNLPPYIILVLYVLMPIINLEFVLGKLKYKICSEPNFLVLVYGM